MISYTRKSTKDRYASQQQQKTNKQLNHSDVKITQPFLTKKHGNHYQYVRRSQFVEWNGFIQPMIHGVSVGLRCLFSNLCKTNRQIGFYFHWKKNKQVREVKNSPLADPRLLENFRKARTFGCSVLSLVINDNSRGEYTVDEHVVSDESNVPLNRGDMNFCRIKSSNNHSVDAENIIN